MTFGICGKRRHFDRQPPEEAMKFRGKEKDKKKGWFRNSCCLKSVSFFIFMTESSKFCGLYQWW